jgi:hypothetical protein
MKVQCDDKLNASISQQGVLHQLLTSRTMEDGSKQANATRSQCSMHNLMKKFCKVQRVVGEISARWGLDYIKKFDQTRHQLWQRKGPRLRIRHDGRPTHFIVLPFTWVSDSENTKKRQRVTKQ